MTPEEYNKFVKKRYRKLLAKKIFLLISFPIWVIPFLIYHCILKSTWDAISEWVENRNPGPRKENK